MPLIDRTIRALLVEADYDIAAGLGAFLEPRGVTLDYAYTAQSARALISAAVFDVVVLDVQLPDGNGIELCQELKSHGLRSPVLFLSARGGLDDKLRGFDAGGADYMVKPFSPAELLARIRALVRHTPAVGGVVIKVGDLTLDHQAGLLTAPGGHLALNMTGVAILKRLMQASPGSVSRGELNALLWGGRPPPSDPLRMHIYELRLALAEAFGKPVIATVRGLGYRIDCHQAGALPQISAHARVDAFRRNDRRAVRRHGTAPSRLG